jgi:predicted tellurium resistance membrane protein TerC
MVTEAIISLLALISLEVILGIDNIIFISILADKLPQNQREKLRFWGLALALVIRLLLLLVVSWIMKLDQVLFSIYDINITGKQLILIIGGLFLLYKSVKEIYHSTEVKANQSQTKNDFKSLLLQILLLDIVFSVDSIITAVGMTDQLWIMYTAVIVTVCIMIVASKPISEFIYKHPSFKILALCFLILIGTALIAEGLGNAIPKPYIYFSMAFAFVVDIIQMNIKKQ